MNLLKFGGTKKIGMFNLNISKSGIGVSFGVNNIRVGLNKNGLYKSINGKKTKIKL